MARVPASGIQHALRHGAYEAVIASVGASVRSLTCEGRDLIVAYEADAVRPAYRGATLAPWPNRVVDGRYTAAGEHLELALTEPDRGHALHGLAAWLDWEAVDKAVDAVTLEAVVQAQAGYPWRVVVRSEFRLGADGLTQTVTGRNESAEPAPWGTGPHPYLVAGDSPLDEWSFELDADGVLHVTGDRLVPTELRPVEADDPDRFDFRQRRVLGPVEIDHAYTAVRPDADGTVTATVTDAAGHGTAIAWDTACPWVQVHTADLPGGPAQPGHRAGLAVEPMTCAPDAFNDDRYPFDTGLQWLAPGESRSASWRISAV